MKRLSIYFLVIVGAFALTSCNTDAEKEYYKPTGGQEFAFSSLVQTQQLAIEDEGKFTVAAIRAKSNGDVSLEVTFKAYIKGEDENKEEIKIPIDIFDIESSTITFKDGEHMSYFTIEYEYGTLDPAITYFIELTLQTDDISLSKKKTTIVSAKQKLKYIYWGKGRVESSMFINEAEEREWDADFYVADGMPDYAYIKDCYTEGADIYFSIAGGIPVIEDQDTGVEYNSEHGNIFFSLAKDGISFDSENNQLICYVEFWMPKSGAWWGKAFKEVFTFPSE